MFTSRKQNKEYSFPKFECFTLFSLQMIPQTVTFAKSSSWVCYLEENRIKEMQNKTYKTKETKRLKFKMKF